jgi:ABC-2 type transport system permease protein
MRLKWKMTLASLKMFFRQKEAVIWTVLFPLMVIILFSFIKFDGLGRMHLGIANEAGGRAAALTEALQKVKTFEVFEGTRESELRELEKGERDVVLIIPASFSPAVAGSVTAFADVEAKPREAQLASLVLQRTLDELTFQQEPSASRLLLKTEPVKTRNLTYIDFLIPGVLSMAIMQMGIFGVAFSFVSLKKRGILRRLWVTPINPSDFIIAQISTRVIAILIQMVLMIGVGMLFLNLHFVGNPLLIVTVGLLGAVVFLGFGFALAGISKSEDHVAPLANLISLPMMLLSGVFFSRSNLPGFLHAITGLFPLTYLADAMRSVAIDGASLVQVGPQLAGLAAWAVLSVFVAGRMFRWE